jgi:hypothetical protein
MCFACTPEIRAIITKEVLEALGDTKTERHLISTVKYTDDLELPTKKETVLLVTTDRLIEIGKCCGMEMNVGKLR